MTRERTITMSLTSEGRRVINGGAGTTMREATVTGKGTATVSATTTFKKGDRVRDIKFGGTYTVLGQRGTLMVFVEELSNAWIHPANLRLISDRDAHAEAAQR